MFVTQVAGMVLALGSAVAWGGADYSGGLASRRSGFLEVVCLSRLSGLILLILVAAVLREPLPPAAAAGWAAAAGLSGAVGISALYKGLAVDRAVLVIPTAGVVGAAIPVLYGAIADGMLPIVQQAGLATALLGIWLTGSGHGQTVGGVSRWLTGATVAGVGFGGFFISLGQIETETVFSPLAVANGTSFAVTALALWQSRSAFPSPGRNPLVLLAGVLDVTGVACYFLAVRWIRLDVAAVLGSLYPAVTVLLFRALTKEQIGTRQWIGLATCVMAIALIAL